MATSNVKIPPDWLRTPNFEKRSGLLDARKHERRALALALEPPPSCDKQFARSETIFRDSYRRSGAFERSPRQQQDPPPRHWHPRAICSGVPTKSALLARRQQEKRLESLKFEPPEIERLRDIPKMGQLEDWWKRPAPGKGYECIRQSIVRLGSGLYSSLVLVMSVLWSNSKRLEVEVEAVEWERSWRGNCLCRPSRSLRRSPRRAVENLFVESTSQRELLEQFKNWQRLSPPVSTTIAGGRGGGALTSDGANTQSAATGVLLSPITASSESAHARNAFQDSVRCGGFS
ncbi:hypothetical protein BBJ28_00021275 [Nothophytophthora sp. Chile5]|nr:hypothetical protein BBJ28_00021275 [Nothophytophthora sp. Chile5]